MEKDKDFLIEKINGRADEKLRKEISSKKIDEANNEFFRRTKIVIPREFVMDIIKEKDVENPKVVSITVEADDIIRMMKEAAFVLFQEEYRKREQQEFLNKIDGIQEQLDTILSIQQ